WRDRAWTNSAKATGPLALENKVAEGSDGRVGLPLRGLLMLRGLMSTGPPGEALNEEFRWAVAQRGLELGMTAGRDVAPARKR
ncbi:unnamed protein product, partial [Durusdinium trenchii]